MRNIYPWSGRQKTWVKLCSNSAFVNEKFSLSRDCISSVMRVNFMWEFSPTTNESNEWEGVTMSRRENTNERKSIWIDFYLRHFRFQRRHKSAFWCGVDFVRDKIWENLQTITDIFFKKITAFWVLWCYFCSVFRRKRSFSLFPTFQKIDF